MINNRTKKRFFAFLLILAFLSTPIKAASIDDNGTPAAGQIACRFLPAQSFRYDYQNLNAQNQGSNAGWMNNNADETPEFVPGITHAVGAELSYPSELSDQGFASLESVDELPESYDAIAAGREALGDKLTGNVVKEIYVPGRIINFVVKP